MIRPLTVVLMLIACLLSGVLGGCAAMPEARWVERRFGDIGYQSLYTVVLASLDDAGYLVRSRDPDAGRVETDWAYGMSQQEVRGPSRRKVVVELDDEAADWYMLRLRVPQQVVRKGGLLAKGVRNIPDDKWEGYGDDEMEAQLLMAKIQSILRLSGATAERPPGGVGTDR